MALQCDRKAGAVIGRFGRRCVVTRLSDGVRLEFGTPAVTTRLALTPGEWRAFVSWLRGIEPPARREPTLRIACGYRFGPGRALSIVSELVRWESQLRVGRKGFTAFVSRIDEHGRVITPAEMRARLATGLARELALVKGPAEVRVSRGRLLAMRKMAGRMPKR